MKRGSTWSYVIRVKDPETGISKPRWVGGFATEEAAKAARDEARVKAHHGQYIDRSAITVGAYLDNWIEAHAVEIKPKTLQDYRHLINRHVRPHLGELRLQAITPARITKLYRDLLTGGGRKGAGLSPRTVAYVHAVLRKAFRDAVVVEQLLPSNPVERAKRPRKGSQRTGNGMGSRPARRLPGHSAESQAVRLLPPGRLHRRPPRGVAESALAGYRPRRAGGPHYRIGGRHRRPAARGNDQKRPVPHGQHRR
ncbi:MAG TPA: hypothetical protein DHU96_05810, partial [Actinobacteria bacterium]|nr:hypothetical protein [Actinomycetota bacterium]